MEIFKDETGAVYQAVLNGLKEDLSGLQNDLTIGVKCGKLLLAGVVYSVVGKVCCMTIYSTSPSWCTKANLSQLFELPFDIFDIKVVKAGVSHKNKKANKFLRRLKLREEGYLRYARSDGSHEVVFSLTLKELKEKRWYK
jgi:hypothetical protein